MSFSRLLLLYLAYIYVYLSISIIIIIIIIFIMMHQSIPVAPSPPPPPGYCGAFAHLPALSVPGGAFANFALSGGQAFVNPGAIPELLTRTQFPIRI